MKTNFALLLLIFFVFVSCTSSLKNNYSGYIYLNMKPLTMAKITIGNDSLYTLTDDKGYFKLNKPKNYLVHKIIIIQKNKEIDTVFLIRKDGADAKPYSLFLRDKVIDTLHLDRERVFNEQSKRN